MTWYLIITFWAVKAGGLTTVPMDSLEACKKAVDHYQQDWQDMYPDGAMCQSSSGEVWRKSDEQ